MGIRWGSVVASRNFTCSGGSSRVFNRALKLAIGEHVHLVDEVDLVRARVGRELHVVHELAGLVHLGPGRGIHLDEIHVPALVDLRAAGALPAGRRAHPALAVQAAGQDPRHGGLAHAAGPGEQKRMMHAVLVQGVAQSPHHVGLTDQTGEGAGPEFAR